MSTLESIFKKWNENSEKTELASERIELKILDELKAAQTIANKTTEAAYKDAEKAEKLYQSVNATNKKRQAEIEQLYEETRKRYQDARDAAKDLGLDVPKEWDVAIDNLNFATTNVPVSNIGEIFPL